MKILILLILFLPLALNAAVGAGMVWEIRSSANAGNVNSCGFNPANTASNTTDYSQQDNHQFSFSDLVTTNGTTNPCVVTSGNHNFVTADVGNTIKINSGGTFTAGWYEIVSVASNAATLDRACASTASTSAGVWREGGACSLAVAAGASSDDSFFEMAQPGNKFYAKTGTYPIGGTVTIAAAGGTQNLIYLIGYQTNRDDTPAWASLPLFDAGAAAFTFGAEWAHRNMAFTSSQTLTVNMNVRGSGSHSRYYNTRTATAGAEAVRTGANSFLDDCEAVSYRGVAVGVVNTSNSQVDGCYIHDSDIGINDNNTTLANTYKNNLIVDNVSAGIKFTAAKTGTTLISNNTLYGAENKLGTGIHLSVSGATQIRVSDNILYGFATGISHADAGQNVGFDTHNNYFNNTTDVTNWTKGIITYTLNPNFKNVTQLTGSTATTSGTVLTQTGADFSVVTNNVDFIYIKSGTGITSTNKFLITSHTTTTLTLSSAPGDSAGGNVVWQITLGKNFMPGINMKAIAMPSAFNGSNTTNYFDIGAAQRREPKPARIH